MFDAIQMHKMSVNELIHRVSIETVKNKTECVRRLCFFLFSAGEREHVGLSTWFNEPIRCCADENHTNEFALSLRTPYPITHRIHVHHCHRQPTHTRTHSGSTIVSNSKIQIQWKMSNVRSRLDFLFFFSISFILCMRVAPFRLHLATLCSFSQSERCVAGNMG